MQHSEVKFEGHLIIDFDLCDFSDLCVFMLESFARPSNHVLHFSPLSLFYPELKPEDKSIRIPLEFAGISLSFLKPRESLGSPLLSILGAEGFLRTYEVSEGRVRQKGAVNLNQQSFVTLFSWVCPGQLVSLTIDRQAFLFEIDQAFSNVLSCERLSGQKDGMTSTAVSQSLVLQTSSQQFRVTNFDRQTRVYLPLSEFQGYRKTFPLFCFLKQNPFVPKDMKPANHLNPHRRLLDFIDNSLSDDFIDTRLEMNNKFAYKKDEYLLKVDESQYSLSLYDIREVYLIDLRLCFKPLFLQQSPFEYRDEPSGPSKSLVLVFGFKELMGLRLGPGVAENVFFLNDMGFCIEKARWADPYRLVIKNEASEAFVLCFDPKDLGEKFSFH